MYYMMKPSRSTYVVVETGAVYIAYETYQVYFKSI
jgi:hypothetical protein